MYIDQVTKYLISVTAALIVLVATTPDVALSQTSLHASMHVHVDVLPTPSGDFHYRVKVVGSIVHPRFFTGGHDEPISFEWHSGKSTVAYTMTQELSPGIGGFDIKTDGRGSPTSDVCQTTAGQGNTVFIHGTLRANEVGQCTIVIHIFPWHSGNTP